MGNGSSSTTQTGDSSREDPVLKFATNCQIRRPTSEHGNAQNAQQTKTTTTTGQLTGKLTAGQGETGNAWKFWKRRQLELTAGLEGTVELSIGTYTRREQLLVAVTSGNGFRSTNRVQAVNKIIKFKIVERQFFFI
ncbi:unnamed protein product [Hermetia illucens]|uniref:Uncharacterized protein n=1 Tax=Hermetia illucens TaxID=343691 RepID=A0A7R8Z2Q6_HERIL|nr:unnamed protein product [Hermetia illucens]